MAGWYELNRIDDDRFHFTLNTATGEVVLSSQVYTTTTAAHDGIASVNGNAGNAERYSREIASNGRFYFTLRTANNKILGISQIYSSESSREAGIVSVIDSGSSIEVRDLT